MSALSSIGDPTATRSARRFVFRKQFKAKFGEFPIRLVDLSATGAQAEHAASIAPGTESLIEIAVPGAGRRLSLRARVVWSRDEESTGVQRIGLAITDSRFDLAADLIDQMVRMRWVDVESVARPRPASKILGGAERSLEEARRALAFVAHDTPAAKRWRERVRETSTPTQRFPIEVLAAWELLAQSIDIEIVAHAYRENETFVFSGSELLADEKADNSLAEARRALDFLSRNSATAKRWFALVRGGKVDDRYPLEVIAAWELLGRNVDIDIIAVAHGRFA